MHFLYTPTISNPKPRVWNPTCLLLALCLLAVGCQGGGSAPPEPVSPKVQAGDLPSRAGEPNRGERGELMVVIDPGHGGLFWGASGSLDLAEKEITLAIGKLVEEDLIRTQSPATDTAGEQPPIPPIRVSLTRQDDYTVTLPDRISTANRLQADLFISIHCNSSPQPGPRGFEVYTLPPPEPLPQPVEDQRTAAGQAGVDSPGQEAHQQATVLAAIIRKNLATRLPWPDRGTKQGDFQVLRGLTMPAVVVEVGFINHPQDGPALATPEIQGAIAGGLGDSVREYLSQGAPGETSR